MIRGFRDLEVYKEAYGLMLLIHQEVKKLPTFERNDLASQMRRASKSCPSNIAEGWAKRRFEKEFKRHLDAAIGSANEMEVHIETARDLSYWDKEMSTSLLKMSISRKIGKHFNSTFHLLPSNSTFSPLSSTLKFDIMCLWQLH